MYLNILLDGVDVSLISEVIGAFSNLGGGNISPTAKPISQLGSGVKPNYKINNSGRGPGEDGRYNAKKILKSIPGKSSNLTKAGVL